MNSMLASVITLFSFTAMAESPFFFELSREPVLEDPRTTKCISFSGRYGGYCETEGRREPYQLSLSQIGCGGLIMNGSFLAIGGQRTDSLATSEATDSYVTQLRWNADQTLIFGAQHKSFIDFTSRSLPSQRQGYFQISSPKTDVLVIESHGETVEGNNKSTYKNRCTLQKI